MCKYKRSILAAVSALLLIIFFFCSCLRSQTLSPNDPNLTKLGGECIYKTYDGFAHITSIQQTAKSKQQAKLIDGPGYEGYEVYFVISLSEPISESWAREVVAKEQLFTLINAWFPGERYLEKYGLEIGENLPIQINVIQKGTCTPLILDFKTVDRSDYFESKQ